MSSHKTMEHSSQSLESVKNEASIQERLNNLIAASLDNNDIDQSEAKAILELLLDEKKQVTLETKVRWARLQNEIQKKVADNLNVGGAYIQSDIIVEGLKKRAVSTAPSANASSLTSAQILEVKASPGVLLQPDEVGVLQKMDDVNTPRVTTVLTPAMQESERTQKTTIGKTKESIDSANHLDVLSNLNGDDSLDNNSRDFVSETALKNALSHAIKGGKSIDDVYKDITGTSPDWTKPQESARAFQEALRVNIAILRQLTGNGNAGLNALLEGKTKAFIDGVSTRVALNGGKPLEVKIDEPEKMSSTTYNLIGAAVTLGVAVVTKGIVTVGSEERQKTADSAIEQFKAEQEGKLSTKALGALSWIKEAFMGRRLSLTLGRERVADFNKKVAAYTEEVMGLNPDTKVEDIKNPQLATSFATALQFAKTSGIDAGTHFDRIQKALIQSYILNEGIADQGSNYSGSIGLFMLLGGHKDTIAVNSKKTQSSEFNDAERDVTRTKLNKNSLEKVGIKIKKNDKKEWTYTIPQEIKMEGDYKKFPVVSSLPVDADGNFIHTSTKLEEVVLSHNGDAYTIVFSSAKNLESVATEQVSKQAVNLRERESLNHKPMADKLFYIGHDPKFNELTKLLGRQDFDGAKALLEKMSKKGKFRTLAKNLLSSGIPMETWTSYMYGSSESRAKQAYTQEYADKKVRTKATTRAEARLATELGIPASSNESVFRIEKGAKFTSKQASEVYPGQEMTMACFATPLGGAHRLDTYDGSVSIMGKTELVKTSTEKETILRVIRNNTTESKGLGAHLAGLNTFLAGKATVNMDQYIAYLASGDITKLGVPGLNVQPGKEPKVFEGRAMIAGNVCLNRLYGVVYPAFAFGSVAQEVVPPVSMDMSTSLNVEGVETTTSDLGVNILGIINKVAEKSKRPDTNEPKPDTTPGEVDNGLVPTAPAGTPVTPQPATVVTTPEIIVPTSPTTVVPSIK